MQREIPRDVSIIVLCYCSSSGLTSSMRSAIAVSPALNWKGKRKKRKRLGRQARKLWRKLCCVNAISTVIPYMCAFIKDVSAISVCVLHA